MAEQIKFACEQGSLTIEVFGYERPGAEGQDDANWLKCEVAIKAGPFSGAFKSAFTTYDLIALAERLKGALATLSGTVSFQNTEHDVGLDIAFDKRGTASINGTAQPHRSLEASLTFRFDTDQSCLAETQRQLEPFFAFEAPTTRIYAATLMVKRMSRSVRAAPPAPP